MHRNPLALIGQSCLPGLPTSPRNINRDSSDPPTVAFQPRRLPRHRFWRQGGKERRPRSNIPTQDLGPPRPASAPESCRKVPSHAWLTRTFPANTVSVSSGNTARSHVPRSVFRAGAGLISGRIEAQSANNPRGCDDTADVLFSLHGK